MDGILDKFGLGLTAGVESDVESNPTNPVTETVQEPEVGTESEDQMANEVLDLIAANESLDRDLHTGLTDGLESVAETYKLVMLSEAIHYMDGIAAGTESEDMPGIESALRFAGVDVAEFAGYDAGTEAREGGVAQPFRSAGSAVSGKLKSAGNKISESKAYKAVSDSFAGKAARSVSDKVKRFFAWLKEKLFGKEKQYNSVLEKYKASNPELAAEISKLENQLASAIRGKEHAVKNLREKLKLAKSDADKSSKEVEIVKAELVLIKAAQKKEIAELQEKLKATSLKGRGQSKAITDAWNADAAAKSKEIEGLKAQNAALKAREAELMEGSFAAQHQAHAENKALMALVVGLLGAGSAPSTAVSTEVVETVTPIAESVPEAAPVVAEILANEATIQNLRAQTTATIQKEAGARLSKSDKKKLANIKGGVGSRKRGGNLSEEYDLSSFINFGIGVESENVLEDTDDMEEAVESFVDPFIVEDMASYEMLVAIEAGIECMNIDEFGHPYIGVDTNAKKVIAFTDRYTYGEAGIEAEETAAEEKPSEVAKSEDAKKEGFFANAGKKIKKAGQWTRVKAKQFWAWLKSKIGILDAMVDRLAMLTSKKVDLSELNETEVAEALAGIEANLDKVIKMKDAEYDGKAKSVEDYAKAIKDAKAKVSGNTSVSILRLLGAGHLVSKVKKAKKVAEKATADKLENAAEMTSIMTSTNSAIAKLSAQVKGLISSVKKASEKTEEKPAEEAK